MDTSWRPAIRADAIRAQNGGRWADAAVIWRELHEEGHATTYSFIAEACARGDLFRELVRKKLEKAGVPLDIPYCPMLDRTFREATVEVYG